jgi:hypothetical protein
VNNIGLEALRGSPNQRASNPVANKLIRNPERQTKELGERKELVATASG